MTGNEMNVTRATGRLPGVDIEIVHRPAAQGQSEQISIHLTATPAVEAFGRALETANPFALWTQTMQLAWMPYWGPWLETMRALSAPWMQLPWFPNDGSAPSAPRSPRE